MKPSECGVINCLMLRGDEIWDKYAFCPDTCPIVRLFEQRRINELEEKIDKLSDKLREHKGHSRKIR